MLRRAEQVADRRILGDPAILHDDHAVGDLGHQAHVMADQDQAAADPLLHAAQRLHHHPLGDDVECAGRLVGDDQARLQRDGDGNAGALLHSTGELMRITLRHRFR